MNLQKTIDTMILSASGWRGIFAKDGDGESMTGEISDDHVEVSALAASRNPVGYNGLKFGLPDGGVLKVEEAELERELIKWQRRMVLEADENLCG
jgi:hypothetical protein